jgi:hypothetical protein
MKIKKIIIISALLVAAVTFAASYDYPQPEIQYDMTQILQQMKGFTDEYAENGPRKTAQLIYLFSDSVPAVTVENVFAQAKKINSAEFTGCLRGFKGDTDKDLRAFIEKQVAKGKIDNLEVRLDPFFYRDLNINNVPALVYAECTRYPTQCDYKYVIQGDSRLEYLVEQMLNADKNDITLQQVLNDLKS